MQFGLENFKIDEANLIAENREEVRNEIPQSGEQSASSVSKNKFLALMNDLKKKNGKPEEGKEDKRGSVSSAAMLKIG